MVSSTLLRCRPSCAARRANRVIKTVTTEPHRTFIEAGLLVIIATEWTYYFENAG